MVCARQPESDHAMFPGARIITRSLHQFCVRGSAGFLPMTWRQPGRDPKNSTSRLATRLASVVSEVRTLRYSHVRLWRGVSAGRFSRDNPLGGFECRVLEIEIAASAINMGGPGVVGP